MEIPIFNSIYNKKQMKSDFYKINFDKLNNLNFKKINNKKFPLVNILKYLPKENSLFETVIVSANDELVRLYLNKKIRYNEISKKLLKLIKLKKFMMLKKISPSKIGEIEKLDKYVRLKINSKSV